MSLAFLAKKPWHTATVKNVEKVWLAEQKRDEEEKRLGELKKQIDEEREIDELRRLQKDQGLVTDPKQKLEWMYEGPGSAIASAEAAEEYKLGKEYVPTQQSNDLDRLNSKKAVGSTWLESKTGSANEEFVRVNEDPLLKMRQSERAERDAKVLKNPLAMKRIRHALATELRERDQAKRARKEARKALKKKKKDKKKKTRKRSRDSDGDSDDDSRSAAVPRSRPGYEEQPVVSSAPPRGNVENNKQTQFGLTKGEKTAAPQLGPPRALLEAREREEALRGRHRAPHQKKALSEAELAQRRREMELDGKAHEARRAERMKHHRKSAVAECLEEDDRLLKRRRDLNTNVDSDDSDDDLRAVADAAPRFLRQARTAAYGDTSTADLADSVQRTRNRHQRKAARAADFFEDD
mmetsp:Transcript_217/g.627  ORF Transcript_217/g.627 Transcript_217/m.627 type:complete len:408 (+) Transcript_217:164-1387(+)|eukprot:CAMPEP_0198649760 /NCGR_PEP_ID=MMETSP1467-20131203/4497_1 /TAXON_ID=1462469 /ORGANISM="unid. sp., Strain CCMP2135" /LENGTH=407 /DNA_ID=CAMNT_0044385559 /DNA_START=94 /DNA_END=1317 /DNA_ORIENTATION=-